MHQSGGSGGRNDCLRSAGLRQRGAMVLACVTSSWVAKTFHNRAVLSTDAVTMRLPSGLNAALKTVSSWPLRGSLIGLPVSASHSSAVLSVDAVTMRLPSGLNAAG